ncbi:chemotaxis protein CheW [Thermodesulfobacteriota bacterium]
MLLLLFEIGNGRYALETNRIIEIVPLVNLKKIPTTPAHVAGLMNYRGEGIPVVDLCQLIDNSPFEDVLSTRIIIVSYPIKNLGEKPLGLIANNVTETVRTKLNKPPPTGVFMDSSLYNGDETHEASDMIQWFDVKKILAEEEIALLFEEEK